MAVLLLGATGFIGPHIVSALEADGHDVVPVSRSGGGPRGVAAHRQDVARVRALARERRASTVVDLLAYTNADTEPLWDALDGEIERWVMASSCDVYRNYDGLHRRRAAPPTLGFLAEDAPLRASRYPYRSDPRRDAAAADAWLDDYDKIPLEAALMARPSLGGVILRLPMVFGPQDRQRRFRWLLGPMLAQMSTLTVDPAWAAWETTYGFVVDVAHGLATAATHPAAAGRIFNLGLMDLGDHRDWIERFAAALGWRGEVIEAPAAPDSPIASLDLRYPLRVDSREFRRVCAWSEPTSLHSALSRTIDDEARRG